LAAVYSWCPHILFSPLDVELIWELGCEAKDCIGSRVVVLLILKRFLMAFLPWFFLAGMTMGEDAHTFFIF
jgi:hypothetical protein